MRGRNRGELSTELVGRGGKVERIVLVQGMRHLLVGDSHDRDAHRLDAVGPRGGESVAAELKVIGGVRGESIPIAAGLPIDDRRAACLALDEDRVDRAGDLRGRRRGIGPASDLAELASGVGVRIVGEGDLGPPRAGTKRGKAPPFPPRGDVGLGGLGELVELGLELRRLVAQDRLDRRMDGGAELHIGGGRSRRSLDIWARPILAT